MDMISMCRICLDENVTMHSLVNTKLQDLYEKLTAMPFQTENSQPLQVCYICRARLQSCYRLQLSCLRSEDLLTKMFANNQMKTKRLQSVNTFKIAHPLVELSCVPATLEEHHDDQAYHDVKLINMTDVHIKEENIEDTEENITEEFGMHYTASANIVKVEEVDVEDHDVSTYSHHMTHETHNLTAERDIKPALRDIDRTTRNDLKPTYDMVSVEFCDNKLSKPIKESIFKTPKTNAEMCKSYYNRKKAAREAERIRQGLSIEKPIKKTGAERTRACRLRKKMLSQVNESFATDILSVPSSSNSRTRTFEPPVQLTTTSAGADLPDVATVSSTGIADHDGTASVKNTKLAEEFVDIQSALTSQHKAGATYESHITIQTGDKAEVGIETPFKCDICKKWFVQKQHFMQHIGMHTAEKPSICDMCDEGFNQKHNLIRRIEVHTGGKPYKCDLCEKCFTRRQDLTRHSRIHTGDKPYKCDVCVKSFNQKHNLARHMKLHADERPYKCDLCEECFARRRELKRHRQIHTGDKPYKCDMCDKSFIQKHSLVRHIIVHTGEKPYKCDVCEKCFIQQRDLKRHCRIHTGDKPYKCDICDKRFNQKHNLVRHHSAHR